MLTPLSVHGGSSLVGGMASRGVIGIVLIAIGKFISRIGMAGVAGSGLVLNPNQAKEDLKPWTKMAGGMIDDAMSEVDSFKSDKNQEIIKVRCLECKSLNDEDAKFCKSCGKSLF